MHSIVCFMYKETLDQVSQAKLCQESISGWSRYRVKGNLSYNLSFKQKNSVSTCRYNNS